MQIGFKRRILSNTLLRNSSWMFLGYGLKIVAQAGYFILIARSLGPSQYGLFVGVVALIGLMAPFGGIGSGNLLVKNVSRDRSVFPQYWGNALLVTALSGLAMLSIVALVTRVALPRSIPLLLVILIGLADLLFAKGAELGAQGFQAAGDLRRMAFLTLLPTVLRMVGAVVVFLEWQHATALLWSCCYLGCTLLSAAVAIPFATFVLGSPQLALWRVRSELLEGVYFGMSTSAQTIYNDIDKAMLLRLSTLDATGIYAAAYRLIDVAFTPVRSVLNAALPEFFRQGEHGVAVGFAYAARILPKMICYSLAAFALVYLSAPLIPTILGHGFARTVEALRWLAILPLLKTIHYFVADSLTGSGHQGVRTAAQAFVAFVNVGLNLWLIPAYSWRGAAWASVLSDGALVVVLYVSLVILRSRATTNVLPQFDRKEAAIEASHL